MSNGLRRCDEVLLASEDEEFGLVWCGEALERAKALAKKEQIVICIRDPITDRAYRCVRP